MRTAKILSGVIAGGALWAVGCTRPVATATSASPPAAQKVRPAAADLRRLGAFMAGHYSSAAQAAADTSYRNVRLHVVPIWPEQRRQGQYFLYAEQALATATAAPFWQRVYRLSRTRDGHIESATFLLAAPRRFAGAWQNPAQHPALRALRPDSLRQREGCALFLSKTGPTRFEGTTAGYHCPSTWRGATYATSEVLITPTELRTWNRGFDVFGKQKWGATKGAYVFVKEK